MAAVCAAAVLPCALVFNDNAEAVWVNVAALAYCAALYALAQGRPGKRLSELIDKLLNG